MTTKNDGDGKSFEENYRKLEQIAQELHENRISIDQLVPKTKEALEAIKVCKALLRETKSQLKEIQDEFLELVGPGGSVPGAAALASALGASVLLLVSLTACTVPTLRALRIAPMDALRNG